MKGDRKMKMMVSRYNGKCAICKKAIQKGETIGYDGQAYHESCVKFAELDINNIEEYANIVLERVTNEYMREQIKERLDFIKLQKAEGRDNDLISAYIRRFKTYIDDILMV